MRSRQKILDATLGLIERSGFGAVNMAAVAAAAGVSRQTVYSIFGSREDLVSQAVIQVATETLSGVYGQLSGVGTATEYLVEAIVAGRAHLRANPVLTALLTSQDGNPLFDDGMMARARPVATQLVAPAIALAPELAPRTDDVVEVTMRLALSVILFDSDMIQDDESLRQFLTRWLAPALENR